MGLFDNLKKKATDAVDEHGARSRRASTRPPTLADKKTKGKHGGQIDKGAEAAKDALDKLDGKDDDIPDGPAAKP